MVNQIAKLGTNGLSGPRARIENITGTGSGRAVGLLGQQLGTSMSAALEGVDGEDIWHLAWAAKRPMA